MRLVPVVTALSLLAAPVFAQNSVSSTTSPPSYNAGSSTVETLNSLPVGAATSAGNRAGEAISSAPPQPGAMATVGNGAGTQDNVPPAAR